MKHMNCFNYHHDDNYMKIGLQNCNQYACKVENTCCYNTHCRIECSNEPPIEHNIVPINNTTLLNEYKCEVKENCIIPITPAVERTGGQIIADTIIRLQGGNGKIWGIPGTTTYLFDDAAQDAIDQGRLEYIQVSHESSGAYAASMWSDYDINRVGVCMSTRGPGVTTVSSGLASATREELPLLYISAVAIDRTSDIFQILDPSFLDPITKKILTINTSIVSQLEIENIIEEAYYTALDGTTDNPGEGVVAVIVETPVWTQKYNMTGGVCKYVRPNIVLTGNESTALTKIISQWNLQSTEKITFRLGPRVKYETALKIIELANNFPQVYVTTVFDARSLLDPAISPKFLDMEGPIGNSAANTAVKNSNLVIDAGVGVIYTTLVDDVLNTTTRTVIRLFDEPIEKVGYFVNVDNVLDRLYARQADLQVGSFYPVENPTIAFERQLNQYLNVYAKNTIGYLVASCVNEFYGPNYTVNNDYNHITDSGTATFMAAQLLRSTNHKNVDIFTEYAPIGLGTGSASGKIFGTNKDTVLYIGDGGLMSMLGSLIDLNRAAISTGSRALILLFDDHKYGNVALGDLAAFGAYKEPTSTVNLHKYFDFSVLLSSLTGVVMSPSVQGTNLNLNFLRSFINRAPGFQHPGTYIMIMYGITSPFVPSIPQL